MSEKSQRHLDAVIALYEKNTITKKRVREILKEAIRRHQEENEELSKNFSETCGCCLEGVGIGCDVIETIRWIQKEAGKK